MERLKQIGDSAETKEKAPNLKICVWCVNRGNESCIAKCQGEGKYLSLEPEELEQWEPGPRLPTFKELSCWSPQERLAILYLVCHYQSSKG